MNPIRVLNTSLIIKWFAPLKMPWDPYDKVELNDISDRRELNLPNLSTFISVRIDLELVIRMLFFEFWKLIYIIEEILTSYKHEVTDYVGRLTRMALFLFFGK